jgi:GxxExxY protein
VYKNALYCELLDNNLQVEKEVPITVYYKTHIVGNYKADLIVDDLVILELKTIETLTLEHEYQLINYLKATNKEVGLLLNFGKKPEVKRKAYANARKNQR